MNIQYLDYNDNTNIEIEVFALILDRKIYVSDLSDIAKQINMKNETFYVTDFSNNEKQLGIIFINKNDVVDYDKVIEDNTILCDWDNPQIWSVDYLNALDKLLSSKYKNMLVQTIRVKNPELFKKYVDIGLFEFIYNN